jgi:aryl-alcohol dehydrogenase-like predicted oxidoreductase
MAGRLPSAILGRTGLEVTRFGYGALELKGSAVGGRDLTDSEASGVLNSVLDSGITFIDTADCYGTSEEVIGRHLSRRRSEYVLATKAGCHRDAPPSGGAKDLTRDGLIYNVERSLKRLRTDHIDLLLLHTPVVKRGNQLAIGDAERQEILATLEDLRGQGKFRWLGVSTNIPHLGHFYNWGVFDAYQLPYSVFNRDHETWITRFAEEGLGTIVRSGAARGERDDEGTLAYRQGVLLGPEERWRYFDALGLDELREDGESRIAFILRYCLAHPGVSTVINGTINDDELSENLRTAQRGPLPRDVVTETNRRLATVDMVPAKIPRRFRPPAPPNGSELRRPDPA